MKKTSSVFIITILSYLAYTCVYLCRLNLSVASVSLRESGYMSEAEIGVLSGLFLAAYALGKLVFGRTGDRFSPKSMILSGLFLCAFSNLAFSFFPPVPFLYALWFINGIAQSLIWGPILRIVSSHVPENKRSTVISLLVTCVGAGSILGTAVATIGISVLHSVPSAFFIPAGVTAVVAIVFLVFVHDAKDEKSHAVMSTRELISDPAFRRMALPAFLHGVIKDNINTWLCLFFATVYNLDLKSLALYIFLVPTLTLVGRIMFLPVLRLFRGNENLVASSAFFITAVFTLILATLKLSLPIALICFSLTACLISMANTTLLSVFPSRYLERGGVSAAASYMDVLTYSGASVGSLIFGVVVKSFGYSPMFLSWFVIALISGVAMLYKSKN